MTTGIPEQWKASLGKHSFQGSFLTECQFLKLAAIRSFQQSFQNAVQWLLGFVQPPRIGRTSWFSRKVEQRFWTHKLSHLSFHISGKANNSNQEAAGTIAGVTAFTLPHLAAQMSVLFSWKHQTRDEMHLFYGLSEAGLQDLQRSVPELSYDPR